VDQPICRQPQPGVGNRSRRSEAELREAIHPRTRVVLAFEGFTVPTPIRKRLTEPAAGVTLFRPFNVRDAGQVRELTRELQACAEEPLLIAADQEGGQLSALGDVGTPFPGAMALGAVGDPGLAERVGEAIGLELRALGINLNYSPVCDLALEPANLALGIRSFGDGPGLVGRLAAATVRGLQSVGVAAAIKHFPGLGAARLDSHHGLAVIDGDEAQFQRRELIPFAAAIDAGARVVMSGHVATPGLTGNSTLPATLSRSIMGGLLRDRLGFDGVTITDALDMGAIGQGADQLIDVLAALRAGVDLLLTMDDPTDRDRIERGLRQIVARELLDTDELRVSASRLAALRAWLAGFEVPDLSIVRCADHEALGREVAERSITLVRDQSGLLPLTLERDARILAIMPQPVDLTPADTSSYVVPALASALRAHHARVEEVVVGQPPSPADIAGCRERAGDSDLVVVGTIAANVGPAQGELVRAVLATGAAVVTVALRTPFDLVAYPEAPVHLCTYGILPVSMDALAAALFGRIPFSGRLPAAIPGLAATGHANVLARHSG
jgi:beta-N-acetylhexosaminidase